LKKTGLANRVYFDTCYIAKFYFNEPESPRVRELVRKADVIHSSLWALAEFHAVLHRHIREGALPPGDARKLAA
jgi:predicted nucleic acid-binding protein